MDWFKIFMRYQWRFEFAAATLLLFINATVRATTEIMDDRRSHGESTFFAWEPFVWEFSSLIMWVALVPLIIVYLRSSLCGWTKLTRTVLSFALFSGVVSAIHVAGMVAIRELAYWSQAMQYEFGDVVYGFFYEYRKDVLTLILLIAIIQSHRFIMARLRGEANIVRRGEYVSEPSLADRILVKKLGKEFIVKIGDIEWLEACGNYVNLHVQGRIYPTRNTLTKLMAEIADRGFCRVHRSYAVNLDAVESIETHASGSGEVSLKNGEVLNLSRRYHDELKQRLH